MDRQTYRWTDILWQHSPHYAWHHAVKTKPKHHHNTVQYTVFRKKHPLLFSCLTLPIPIRGRALQFHRPRPSNGSVCHSKKDYYLGTKVLWESSWFLDESHKILYWVSWRNNMLLPFSLTLVRFTMYFCWGLTWLLGKGIRYHVEVRHHERFTWCWFTRSTPTFHCWFLSDRKFQVSVCRTYSKLLDQEMGVTQGSILSVTLFCLKINSVVKDLCSDVEFCLYVDDFLICYRSKHIHIIERQLQRCLNKLQNWADTNRFKFFTSKTVCMHFCVLPST